MGKNPSGPRPPRTALLAGALLTLALLPTSAYAIGLGQPAIHSRPGESLDLSVPVLCDSSDCDHFEVGLAAPADYRAAGLPVPELPGVDLSYDSSLDAIRVRTSRPVPAGSFHLLFDLRAGNIRVRQDVLAVLSASTPVVPQPLAETTMVAPLPPKGFTFTPRPLAGPRPAEAETSPPPVRPAPAAPVVHAPPTSAAAAPAPAAPAPALPKDRMAQARSTLDTWNDYLRNLDPALVVRSLGIGAGLLLTYILLRLLHRGLNRVGRSISYWIGGLRYRKAERKRQAGQTGQEAAAGSWTQLRAAQRVTPHAEPLSASPVSARPSFAAGGDSADPLVRKLRGEIAKQPQRLDLKLKLAERLYTLNDRPAYTELAMELKPLLKETAWERLRQMGQKLSPYDDRFLSLSEGGSRDVLPLLKFNG
jgi:hypothetical protein